MASFTQLDHGQVASIAARLGIETVESWEAIAAGTINSNFALVADAGRFFLRINEGKAEDDVRYEADLVAALAAGGVATPVPLCGLDGRPYVEVDGKLASLFPWVDGTHRCAAGVSEADAMAVGLELARLHRVGAELAPAFLRDGIYTFAHIVDRYRSIQEREEASDPELQPALAAIGEEIAWLQDRADVRAAAPTGVIHADLFRDNVLFGSGGQVAALIDFEQACTGSLVYDLAVCLNAWCYSEDLNRTLVAAMVDGYGEVDPAALYIECRASAMRFAVTRITDVHLADTVASKDFGRYVDRLLRWREVGADGLQSWLGAA